MKTVHKYQLSVAKTTVTMPIGAKILHVDFQQKVLCLWAEVDPSDSVVHERRLFHVIPTGAPMNDNENRAYIGTTFTGPFVLHVFEVTNDQ